MVIHSTVTSLNAWQDISANDFVAAAAKNNLVALTATSYQDITPQLRTSSLTPNITISSGSNIVRVNDVNSGMSVANSVVFDTPISIGNLLLMGGYPINSILSTAAFTILSSIAASTTITSSGVLPI